MPVFQRSLFLDAITSSGLHFLIRLRDDSILIYKYKENQTGKNGALKKFDGWVDPKNPNLGYFTNVLVNEKIAIYSAVV